MKNKNRFTKVILTSLCVLVVCISSCKSNKWSMPKNYLGAWQSGTSKTTIRTPINKDEYKTTSDTIKSIIILNKNKTASGTIGLFEFENAPIKQLSETTDFTGVAYVIKCKKAAKLFERDPSLKKDIEIWFSPINGRIEAELREVKGRRRYRMGIIIFQRRQF